MVLEKELETYKNKKRELVKNHEGKYVLIKKDEIIKILESKNDLMKEGYEKYKNEPFLVKKITSIEDVANFANDCIIAC